jgi:drug/metabolite transporter (DMT)-like permease
MLSAAELAPPPNAIGRLDAALRSPALALTLAALFWSGNFIAGRALRESIDPITLNFARWLTALMLFAPFVWRDVWANIGAVRREWRLVFGLGATGVAAFHTLTYFALQSTTATSALLMLSLAPIAILAGAMMIGLERPNRRQLTGALVSISGAAVLITRGELAVIYTANFVTGDLWMLAAVAIWASYSLLLRRRPTDLPQTVALFASITVALMLLMPLLILYPGTQLVAFASLTTLLGIGYMAVFASLIAFLLWSYGVSKIGPSRSGQFIHLMPVFGAALAVTLLNEAVNFAHIAGAALVMTGIALVERRSKLHS